MASAEIYARKLLTAVNIVAMTCYFVCFFLVCLAIPVTYNFGLLAYI